MNWKHSSFFFALLFCTVNASNVAKISPKVLIISMFGPEESVWHNIPEFDILAKNITVQGLSPLFPYVHCTEDETICQLITGEGEINAASTLASFIHSPRFDLCKTYFLIAGIAGINPKVATIGSVTFARYAVQVCLQFEIDAREMPAGFSTGYFPFGTTAPGQYPQIIYGTEVFELNENLRQCAFQFAKAAEPQLNDTLASAAVRARYGADSQYAAATMPPVIELCDTATSDTFWHGRLLAEGFENTTRLFTNGSATYCTSQEEDNATLNSLMRGALMGLVDFSRIVIMRSGANFDRPPPGEDAVTFLTGPAPGFEPSLRNLYVAGVKVVEGIIAGWQTTFDQGVKPTNYIGDIFGSLGGEPDFGPDTQTANGRV
ncbi:purine nucleoside [Favolaschia claudopus]|uniref:Purine nucleoside n=1 Tax=Favolaschia claudopus TaxID=2862362 RepID=A0AAW0A8J1_9AGAR